MSNRLRCTFALHLAAFALFFSPAASAQGTPPEVSDQVLGGTGGKFENIELSNGGVNLTIPVLRVKGRGIDFIYTVSYTSKIWFIDTYPVWPYNEIWNFKQPWAAASNADEGMSGGAASLLDTCEVSGLGEQEIWVYYNDRGMYIDGSERLFPTLQINMPSCDDGRTYTEFYDAYSTDLTALMLDKRPDGSAATRDANGNSVKWQTIPGGPYGLQYVDSAGRIVMTKTYPQNQTQLTLADGQIIRIIWTTIPASTSFANPSYVQNCTNCSIGVISRIELPNGRAWVFEYANNSYGQLTKVTLPSGGYIRYTYAVHTNFLPWQSPSANEDGLVVTARYVSPDGLVEHATTYNYAVTLLNPTKDLAQRVVTATDADSNQTVMTYKNIPAPSGWMSESFHETDVEFRQGSSQLLKKLHKDWTCDDGLPIKVAVEFGLVGIDAWIGNCRVTDELTTIYDGGSSLTKKVHYDYDSSLSQSVPNQAYPSQSYRNYTTTFGNITKTLEYDWGPGTTPGPLVRQVDFTYLTTNPLNGNINYLSPSVHIVNKPRLKVVKDAAGCIKSQTEYEYDGSTLTATSGVPQHDYTTYPASNRTRGNLTKVRNWLSTGGSCSTGTWFETINTYDDLGNLRSTTDPGQHTTSFSYTDAYSDAINRNSQAYLTQITYPTTGGTSHIEKKRYYYNTGLLYQEIDQNNQTTTYTYDNMYRPTSVSLPDGGITTYSFNDPANPPKVTTTQKITATTNLVSELEVDGLGRTRKTKLVSDPQGSVYTRVQYDSLARKWKEWNPTRCDPDANPDSCSGETTFGKTEYVYDALGRVTKVIPPDGTTSSNHIATSYWLNTTTVTDQAGKQRRSYTDALGRLIQVDEPNPTLSTPAVTSYTYDTLDNLTQVLQSGSRQRTFTYNSLSQLLSANNPESGAISYTYDTDGNLLTKVSPAPNQTNPVVMVTTTFSYDALHRLNQKSYSDGTTPTAKYGYDGIAPNGCTPPALTINNGIGMRTAMCDGAGAEAWSFDITAGVGWKTTDVRTTNGLTKTTVNQNNFDGSMASLTYPSGPVITYTLQSSGSNTAGRMASAVDTANSINYALNASYAPHGAVAAVLHGQSGGFGGITLTQTYNPRLQPSTILASSTNGTVLNFTYGFNYGTANNGNAASIANNRAPNRSQSFTYDELNRIKTAQSAATSGADCWGLQFGYDIWANLLSASVTKCSAPPLSVGVNTKNQINNANFQYDAAGNLTFDGSLSVAYDAENRITSTNGGVSYTYDGDGKRVKKSNGKLYWYGAGSDPLEETDLSGVASADYIFFGGKRTARLDLPSATVHYYFSDHLGTANVVTSSTGTIQDESDFYPFGGERVITDTDPNQYKFTGKERDTESGLDFFIARYYSSGYGRFLSPDEFTGGPVDAFSSGDPLPPGPLPYADITNPQSLNKYTYTWNNPLHYIDPTGHDLVVAITHLAMVQKLEAESPSFKAELDAARGTKKYNVSIGGQDPFQKIADANVSIYADGQIDVKIKVDVGKEGQLEHEVGHGNDARTNTEQFKEDAADLNKQKKGAFPNKVNDDESPLDKRAETFRKKVERERKQYQKEKKEREKKEEEARKQKKSDT